MQRIRLHQPAATLYFGQALASAISRVNPGALLLFGGLGAGKTTMTRALVQALPGGEEVEASSPSFTVCNIYCTAPLVHHFDLYRLEPGTPDETLAESLERESVLTIVEWSEHMAACDAPEDGLSCLLLPGQSLEDREAELMALGPKGTLFLRLFFSEHPFYQG